MKIDGSPTPRYGVKMKVSFLFICILTLSACAATRVLSDKEAADYGLTAVIYDVRLCPTKFENEVSKVTGKCELVTCEPKSEPNSRKVKCTAKPEPK